MKIRVIYKGKYNAGVLWRDEFGYHFEYNDDFIANPETHAISVNMPKSQKKYTADQLFANFKSILSEGMNREIQCKALGIDLNDDWSLLMHTCEHDTIGAVTLKEMDE